jgi:type 1 glutamine amidotransferase
MTTRRSFLATLPLMALSGVAEPPKSGSAARILIYTRNGKGYVHANIPSCVRALQEIGREAGLGMEVTDDPTRFTPSGLEGFRAIVFANTNNEAFTDDEQRTAFQGFIRNGGGFMGIHSATGSERNWPWYWKLIGGTFAWHHPLQRFTVRVLDKTHPATREFPSDSFEWEDEFYYVRERNREVHVLLGGVQASLKRPGKIPATLTDIPEPYPLAWCHRFEGGRSFYTALGHKNEHYDDPMFRRHLRGGLLWAAGLAD